MSSSPFGAADRDPGKRRDGPGSGSRPDGWGDRPGGAGAPDPAVVTIRIPADPEYVSILRAACGQLAPRLGCTPAEIADLRLAVDEACGLLLRHCVRLRRGTDGDGLAATFVADGPALFITLSMEADAFVTPDAGEFGWTILTALVDGFTWHVDGSTVRVEIRKTQAAGRQG
ncbi:ATP-binding protein [Catenulispora subtropica]|uniref:Anti-sigma regulatory factor n=1 Tax=Catenulispora subtropica TaxID=450798 RepID=A0ABN2SI46_9ACTN